LIWGAGMYLVLTFAAKPIASLFNDNPAVISTIILYLRIASIGYGLQGIFLLSATVMNILNKPLHAATLAVIQMFVLYIPLAFIGSHLFGLPGIFGALALVYCVTGITAHFMLEKILAIEYKK
jgi:Na+-driven multidrug efflux pump